jgi:ubiquinone/menaquinone biosynthesis C-methylase UbiE
VALKAFYEDHILPRCIHFLAQSEDLARHRREALVLARGVVLEIGFGSGLSLPHYPKGAVTRLLAVEPSPVARKLAEKAIRKTKFPVQWAGLDGERIDLKDNSVDTAVSFLTLCTIPKAERALAEVMRVLKPGGAFIFLEHGWSPDAKVQKWQTRLNPLQGKLFGGCHLNRKINELVLAAGFKQERLENFYVRGMPNPMGYAYLGWANKPNS